MKNYLTCFFLFLCLQGRTQYQVQHFSTENGLPSNGVKGMQWDETTGFLWLATEAGLVRYNGMKFKTFDINTNPEIGSNRVVSILKNEKGQIFAGGEYGVMLTVKNNLVTTFAKDVPGAQNTYNHYCAITASRALYEKCLKNPWPNKTFSIFKSTAVPVSDTNCVAWAYEELYYYSLSTPEPVLINTTEKNIKLVFKIGNDLFFSNSVNTIFSLDALTGKINQQQLTDEEGHHFLINDINSNLFWQAGSPTPVLVQNGKAWIVEKEENRKLRFKLVASGIPENTQFNFAVYKAKGNYLFLGSASKGFYIIYPNQLLVKKPLKTDINQPNAFYGQVELPNGNILVNDGSIIGDNPSQNNYNLRGFINNVFNLSDSSFVFLRHDSIILYNKNTSGSILLLRTPTGNDYSFASSGDDLFLATQTGIGIIKNDHTLETLQLFNPDAASHLGVSVMIEASPGKLVLATCKGLLSFNTKTRQIDTLVKLPSACFRSLYKKGDYIFAGTYGGGYYVMKNGRLKAMPLDINQYLKYTHCFMEDKQGFFWISTNNGLFKVKVSDITDAYEKDLPRIYYHYLGKNDGMETTEMNGGCVPCALQLKNKNFSFPTMDGMLWFTPEKVNILLPDGDTYIDRLTIDDRQVLIKDSAHIELPATFRQMEVALVTNAWSNKENLYIEYKLNNEDWVAAKISADEPVIRLSNPGYGEHTLIIRKINGFGDGNYSSINLPFTVSTPYYHRWGFRLLALLSLVGIAYVIFWLRLRQYNIREKKLTALVEEKTRDLKSRTDDLNQKNIELEKNDQIKTRLIAIINHDVITPLKYMYVAGMALIRNKGTLDRQQELETISDMTKTAKDMEMLSSQILNWIVYQNPNTRMQKEEFDLHIKIDKIFAVLQNPAKLKNTNLQNNVAPRFVVYQYKEALRVLIYNLILNAVNFTKDGTVTVSADFEGNNLLLKITDTGAGMTQEQIANVLSDDRTVASANVDNKKGTGLGYTIVKDLLKIMEGTIDITSSRTTGTTVRIVLPGIAMT